MTGAMTQARTRAALVLAGRGSYTERSLGSLPADGQPGALVAELAEGGFRGLLRSVRAATRC